MPLHKWIHRRRGELVADPLGSAGHVLGTTALTDLRMNAIKDRDNIYIFFHYYH
jgi:hypothetical protein